MTAPGTGGIPVTARDALHAPFRLVRFRGGYDPKQVDDFMDQVEVALREATSGGVPALSVADIFDAQFHKTWFELGYARDDVDDFLDRTADTLQAADAA